MIIINKIIVNKIILKRKNSIINTNIKITQDVSNFSRKIINFPVAVS